MAHHVNSLGQPIGEPLADWVAARNPDATGLVGRHCDVVPLKKLHASALFEAFGEDREHNLWTYMSYGPFETPAALEDWIEAATQLDDQASYAIVEKASGMAVGVASYLRIQPAHGVIEVGGITYSPRLQKTCAGTEAMYLMMKNAFDVLGYRRYEWKCDALNAASCKAAERFGFAYDGLFRQAIVYRGRNRDTAWYSILDRDWPVLKSAFESWLLPGNFDTHGKQKRRLSDVVAEFRSAAAP
ncbi:MAG: GNAT family N-acetyltransferase [Alphaproteobacteria bacterium]|nr:GNAT family N-acetyltransferase [Alphaproteobacteria bacterium]